MSWITPKTDWTANDYFTWSDYNRIKNNLDYLYKYAIHLFVPFPFDDPGEDKTAADYAYADEINLLTGDLEKLRTYTDQIVIGTRVTYADNGSYIAYGDLNRIEQACLDFYKRFGLLDNGRQKLEFTLGGGTIRC